jgi:hypothetical protein
VALWLAFSFACAGVAADEPRNRQAQMTAAYVFNFVKFIEWPEPIASDALEVCFLGAEEVREALAVSTVAKQAGDRRMVVRAVQAQESLANCHVVYVDEQTGGVSARRALTIGESEGFTRSGGIIRLYTESNRLRFIVNVDNAKREGIQVSSNLLKLATQVEGGAR